MKTPTTAEIRTAIEVLKMLGHRLDEQSAHSMAQMPETRLGIEYAARIEAQSGEQNQRIEAVAAQLKTWRDELLQERKQHVSQSV